jgi:hypothetical protein
MSSGRRVSTWQIASPRLPRPAGVHFALAIHWLYAAAVTDRRKLNPTSDLVPAQGFEPWTIGLKDRCSAKLSYAGNSEIVPIFSLGLTEAILRRRDPAL